MTDESKSNYEHETTENLEKSMHKAHGVTQEEYKRSLEKKIEVEKEREKDYKKNKEIQTEIYSHMKK
ncbi:hypothetical protein [Alteribacillus bidgolensis]|uniref:Uncharacterized protein n=1 Tax=Alteribacillus bidgolensis TaxID=930129 RepID=A0A1G8JBA3_9BACI|nr:hypothetical protein [Alteribacillus bidgolensis]SDI28267.1 hypothetical protein SAMN05216352_106125 [Alteribacillus bidgolensis]